MNNTETPTTTEQYEKENDCQWTTLDWSRCARKATSPFTAEGKRYCGQHWNTYKKRGGR